MKKFLNIFYNISRKIGKRNFILILFVFIVLIITSLYQTFSLYTESGGVSFIDGVKTYSFILDANDSTNSVTIAAGNSKNIDITISNDSEADLQYGLYYSSNDNLDSIEIGYSKDSAYPSKGTINQKDSCIVSLRVDNDSINDVTIDFGIKYGFDNGTELVLEANEFLIDEFFEVNEPNLDNNNLIPVYFDETEGTYGSWMKADSTNTNNSWYDYKNKEWANAVIIADSAKKATYQSAAVGTVIADADITAFYVWIPRFKYRVWNISRQGTGEEYYAYPAYTSGIQIKFEGGTASTGNVACSYDDQTTESATYLNDNCSVNGTAVAYNTSNLTYGESNQAWYTHPAFNFGGEPKTGFWIGKFETSGTVNSDNIAEVPTILPDVQSLRSQSLSQRFISSKSFQNYLPNSILDAHMVTNLEWGAVSYLSHSIYGMCVENSCSGVNNNNSSNYYTGRSSGTLSDGTYNTYGTYNYKGYVLNDNTPTVDKDITKIASTTKNITGVYDMSGGAYEYVMGNMVSSSATFYPSNAGDAWEGTEWYDNVNNGLTTKYYNSYAYGTDAVISFNRARLGDAITEVLGGEYKTGPGSGRSFFWKVGSSITGSQSVFATSNVPWFYRGGLYSGTYSSIFSSGASTGVYSTSGPGASAAATFSFRSSLT